MPSTFYKKLNNPFKAHTDLFHLHKTTVELPSPNNNREQAGLAAATCSKKPIDLTSLSLKNILINKAAIFFAHCETEAVQYSGP